jgi:UDP-N-acetylmuramate dehydrogenase
MMGLEFCHKIPGQFGGALAGNAGAANWGVCDFVETATFMTRSGRVVQVARGDFRSGYRHSELAEAIILEADLRLERLNEAIAYQRIQEFEEKKKGQPYHLPSSGCVFKNPRHPVTGEQLFAGKLIDEAGLKGYTLNSATVSDGHANFIVNTGAASGEDFLGLINLIQDVVHEKFGVELEVEARIVGGPLTSCVLA